MLNWYEMPGALDNLETNPAYLEKIVEDSAEVEDKLNRRVRNHCTDNESAWAKKRKHKKKMVRRFLSMNPDMDFSKIKGTRCYNCICCYSYKDDNGNYCDPRMNYDFNPYEKIFLSPRGDLRKYHGKLHAGRNYYILGTRFKDNATITNRRIRHLSVYDDFAKNYSYYKKTFGHRYCF